MKYNTRAERPWLNVIVAVVLFLNIIVLGRVQGFYHLPGEKSPLAQAKNSAELVMDHLARGAAFNGLSNNVAVQEAILRLQNDIRKARTVDEVSQALQKGLLDSQMVISRELENARREAVLSILSHNSSILAFKGKTTLAISREETGAIKYFDPSKLITTALESELNRAPALQQTFSSIVVEVENGQVKIPTQRTLSDRITAQEQEIAAMRLELQSLRSHAGYLPLTGPGVRIKLYDAFGGFTDEQIVHDADVRDIVNELNAAGALGISVGGERYTAHTAIRCAGPVILVNQKPIAVNPVVIEAVGDANILISSLSLVKSSLLATKGVKLEVEKIENLTLPAFTLSR